MGERVYVRDGKHHRVYQVNHLDVDLECQENATYYDLLSRNLLVGRSTALPHREDLFHNGLLHLRRLENQGHEVDIHIVHHFPLVRFIIHSVRTARELNFGVRLVGRVYKSLVNLFFDVMEVFRGTVTFMVRRSFYDKFLEVIAHLYPSVHLYFIFHGLCGINLNGNLILIKCVVADEIHARPHNVNGFCILHTQYDTNWRFDFGIARVRSLEESALEVFLSRFDFKYVYYLRHDCLFKSVRVTRRRVEDVKARDAFRCRFSIPFFYGYHERRFMGFKELYLLVIDTWCQKLRLAEVEQSIYYIVKVEGPLLYRPLLWLFCQFPSRFRIDQVDAKRFFLTLINRYQKGNVNKTCILFEDAEILPIMNSNHRSAVRRFREDLEEHRRKIELYFRNWDENTFKK